MSDSKHERDYAFVRTQEEVWEALRQGKGARFGVKRPSFVRKIKR